MFGKSGKKKTKKEGGMGGGEESRDGRLFPSNIAHSAFIFRYNDVSRKLGRDNTRVSCLLTRSLKKMSSLSLVSSIKAMEGVFSKPMKIKVYLLKEFRSSNI